MPGHRQLTVRRVLGVLSLALSLVSTPVLADPTLFTGVARQSGAIIATPNFVTTLPAYATPTTVRPTVNNPAIVSVTPNGDFTVGKSDWYQKVAYTFSLLPTYIYVLKSSTQRNEPGTMANDFFVPNVPIEVNVTNAAFPALTATPRNAFVRLTPGANGFGGELAKALEVYYLATFSYSGLFRGFGGNVGTQAIGGRPLGYFDTGQAGLTYTIPYVGATMINATYNFTAVGGSVLGPWATGMLFLYQGNEGISTTTATGADNRTAGNKGIVSLVTPRIQFVYSGDGTQTGTPGTLRNAFNVIHQLEYNFLPEPGQLALLAGGFAGIVGLYGARRRAR